MTELDHLRDHGARQNQRLRPAVVTILIGTAALLLGLSGIGILNHPESTSLLGESSFAGPDAFNLQLNTFQAIDQVLPKGADLRYLSQVDSPEQLAYLQAVVAPGRVGPDIESPYIYVYAATKDWLNEQSELKNSRLLIKLSKGSLVFMKETSN